MDRRYRTYPQEFKLEALELPDQHIQVSMNGVGNCYDNAPMESFIGTLKTECASAPFARPPLSVEARAGILCYTGRSLRPFCWRCL